MLQPIFTSILKTYLCVSPVWYANFFGISSLHRIKKPLFLWIGTVSTKTFSNNFLSIRLSENPSDNCINRNGPLTSSRTKFQNFSSNSCDRGSPNRVMDASLFSGTAQTTRPLSGFFMDGSQMCGSVENRRLRLVHVTLSRFGCLPETTKVEQCSSTRSISMVPVV